MNKIKVAVKAYGPKALLWAAEYPDRDFACPEFYYMPQVSQEKLQALVNHNWTLSDRAFRSILKQSKLQDK